MLKFLNIRSKKDGNLMKIKIYYLYYKHLKIFLFKFFIILQI